MNRRSFVSNTTLAATAILLPGMQAAQAAVQQLTTMIIHHVFFWLKEPDNVAHAAQLRQGLHTLAAIPQVKQLLVGGPASTEKRPVVDSSYQVSELMYFNSLEDQAVYQEHPIHQAFVQQCSHLWSKVLVYDMSVDQ